MSRPAATLSSVDLPQPVGPTTETNSPSRHRERHVLHGRVRLPPPLRGEGAGDVLEGDGGWSRMLPVLNGGDLSVEHVPMLDRHLYFACGLLREGVVEGLVRGRSCPPRSPRARTARAPCRRSARPSSTSARPRSSRSCSSAAPPCRARGCRPCTRRASGRRSPAAWPSRSSGRRARSRSRPPARCSGSS